MSGAGKWIKKHPLQAVGLLAGAAMGGPAIAGLLGGAGGAAAGAATAGSLAGVGGAEGALGAAEMAMLGESAAGPAAAGGGFMAGLDKLAPYAKLANQGMGLLSQDQPQPMPQMAPPRGPVMAQAGGAPLPYGDAAEEEKWRRMAASRRFYG